MLGGRTHERAELEALLCGVAAGQGAAVMVLRGPAGIGKSALLRYAQSAASGMAVLRAVGTPAESDLAFAGLHQLLRPAAARLDRLPRLQRDALAGALALGPASPSDRFAVSAGVLSLLTEVSDSGGVLCAIDDAHWLDGPSLTALLFGARRLGPERIAVLFAVRDEEDQGAFDGLPTLDLAGLDVSAATALLTERAGCSPAPAVVEALVRATGGNALALSELATLLTGEHLTGRVVLPDPLPVSRGIERSFVRRIRQAPADAQTLVLVAAAEGTGDLGSVLTAARALGAGDAALESAERAGLLQLTPPRFDFSHPLVRAAGYAAAGPTARRRAHQALAEVLSGPGQEDRRAWHRAAAAVGPDDGVATELEDCAARARARSGYAAAATALQRAAHLTSRPGERASRLVQAADDAWLSGQPELALACLDEAMHPAPDALVTAAVRHLRGRIELRGGTAPEAYRILMAGAKAAAPYAPDKALLMTVDAAEAAAYAGDIAGIVGAGRLALQIDTAASSEGHLARAMAGGIATLLEGDLAGARPLLRRVTDAAEDLTDPQWLVWAGVAALYLSDLSSALRCYERAAVAARVADTKGNLPYVLEFLAVAEFARGRYSTSAALSDEGLRLAEEIGQDSSVCQHLANLAMVAALRGEESACLHFADRALTMARSRRHGLAIASVRWARAVLDLGLGRFADALAGLKELAGAAPGEGHPAVSRYSLADRVEAAVRCGDHEDAQAAQAELEVWAAAGGEASMQAAAHAAGALIAADADAETKYLNALQKLTGDVPPLARARTQLWYGEWLRRQRRAREARTLLRGAVETFEQLGAAPWAQRARHELRAAGANVAGAVRDPLAALTPQELRIAELVTTGLSNRDVAERLFVSPRTVEYHLYKIFPKLGIGSRTELVRLVASAPSLQPV